MVRKLVVMFTSVVLLAAANVKALGLGEVTLESALNQPLVARVELLQLGTVRPEQISVSLASARDFGRFSIDRSAFLNSIEFNVESRGAETFIRMTTENAVREPFLSLVLDTRWPSGRVLSEYTMLLDLPTFAANDIAPVIAQPSTQSATATNAPARINAAPQRLAAQTPTAASIAADVLAPDEQAAEAAAPSSQSSQAPAADVVPLASNATTVTVGTDDTLWDIAREVRPSDAVTVQQTMLALQRLNSEAFIADNINMVRRGQVLRIPNIEQIRALSARDAVSEVSRQNQLFENRRNVPLASQPLAAQPNQTPDETTNRGELSIVSDDSADQDGAQSANGSRSAELSARVSGLEDALAVQREETDRVTRRADELSERLRLLEEQIASAQEIIRLRDLELAQLQQSLAAQRAEEEAAALAEPEPVPEPVITMAPEKSFVQNLIDTLMANSFALIGAVVLLVLALVLVLLRRNKKSDDEDLDDLDAMAASVEAQEGDEDQAVTEEPVQQNQEDLDEIFNLAEGLDDEMIEESFGAPQEAAEGHDAVRELLEEADALISHERYEEAISLLQDGIVAEPNSSDLRLKLLEICVAKKDAVGFKLQETELRETATAEVLERITQLKAQLRLEVDDEILEDGDEEFFSELEDEPVDDLELALDMDASADVDDAKVAESVEPTRYSDEAGAPASAADHSEEIATEDGATDADAFDLAADSDEETIEFAVEDDVEASDEPEVANEEDAENLVDFDFTKSDDPESEALSTEPEVDANAVEFDLSDTDSEPDAVATPEHEDSADNEIDFEFDADDVPGVDPKSFEETVNALDALEFGGAGSIDDDDDDDDEFNIEFEEPAKTDVPEADGLAPDSASSAAEPVEDEVEFELDEEEDATSEADEDDEIDWEISSEDESKIDAAFGDAEPEPEALSESNDDEELDIAFESEQPSEQAEPDPAQLESIDPDDQETEQDNELPVADEFDDLQFLSGSNNKSEGDEDDSDDEALDFLSDADEAATKLDLARAYFEMGDKEGAQEILEEVVREGSEEQIKDAKALLEKL